MTKIARELEIMGKKENQEREEKFIEGDVICEFSDGEYHVCRIIRVDYHDDGAAYHTCLFKSLDHLPGEAEVRGLERTIWHAPIAGFPGARKIGSWPVEREELAGFFEYLRQTDFRRWVKETGADLNEIVGRSKDAYDRANALADMKKYLEAIDLYTEAHETFPLFFEALDNRGLTKMDLADFTGAIADFELSLEMNPSAYLPIFSIGECLYKMGDHAGAAEMFLQALVIKPDDELAATWLERARASGPGTERARLEVEGAVPEKTDSKPGRGKAKAKGKKQKKSK